MNRPSYKELLFDERKDREEQLQWIRNAVSGNAKFYREPPYSYEEELAREIMQLHTRIAELETAQCWTPVSEGLPELDQDVFAVVDGELDRGHFYQQWDGEVFFSSDEKGAMMVATHWMPLPDDGEVQE